MNHSQKLVYIIILNWNGWRDTVACLKSLRSLSYGNFQTIVVDNASTDESVKEIRSRFPSQEIIQAPANLGFSGGNNLGIQRAMESHAEYVWLLNNDTKVDPLALTHLVNLAESDNSLGAVGSVLYYMDRPEKVQAWGGGWVSLWWYFTKHYHEPVSREKLHYLTAASLLLRRSALEDVGMLDDGFFLYWEDTDLCFRIRKAGWALDVAHESKVWHRESASLGGKKTPLVDSYFTASSIRFFRRHAPAPFIPITISLLLRLSKRIITGQLQQAIEIVKAIK